jgi:hypothetical protein
MAANQPQKVATTVGRLSLTVPVGYAAAQRIPFTSDWWATRMRSRLPRAVADHLVSSLTKRTIAGPDDARRIPRQALYDLAATGDTAAALFAVTAWGTGTNTLDRGRRARNLFDSIESGRHEHATHSLKAAPDGLDALWDAHFGGRTPQGFGQVSYGTKWLHAAGWDRVPADGPQPVVFDQYVHRVLTRCAGIDLPYPGVANSTTRAAWGEWCRAATGAATGGLTAADVERAVFDHRRACPVHTEDAAHCPNST